MDLVKALAWPIVLLVYVLVLRKQIGQLIGRLTHVSGAGVKAEFKEQIEAAGDIAQAITRDAPNELPPPASPGPTLDGLLIEAELHPVGAMIHAWNIVEAQIRRVSSDDAK